MRKGMYILELSIVISLICIIITIGLISITQHNIYLQNSRYEDTSSSIDAALTGLERFKLYYPEYFTLNQTVGNTLAVNQVLGAIANSNENVVNFSVVYTDISNNCVVLNAVSTGLFLNTKSSISQTLEGIFINNTLNSILSVSNKQLINVN